MPKPNQHGQRNISSPQKSSPPTQPPIPSERSTVQYKSQYYGQLLRFLDHYHSRKTALEQQLRNSSLPPSARLNIEEQLKQLEEQREAAYYWMDMKEKQREAHIKRTKAFVEVLLSTEEDSDDSEPSTQRLLEDPESPTRAPSYRSSEAHLPPSHPPQPQTDASFTYVAQLSSIPTSSPRRLRTSSSKQVRHTPYTKTAHTNKDFLSMLATHEDRPVKDTIKSWLAKVEPLSPESLAGDDMDSPPADQQTTLAQSHREVTLGTKSPLL